MLQNTLHSLVSSSRTSHRVVAARLAIFLAVKKGRQEIRLFYFHSLGLLVVFSIGRPTQMLHAFQARPRSVESGMSVAHPRCLCCKFKWHSPFVCCVPDKVIVVTARAIFGTYKQRCFFGGVHCDFEVAPKSGTVPASFARNQYCGCEVRSGQCLNRCAWNRVFTERWPM